MLPLNGDNVAKHRFTFVKLSIASSGCASWSPSSLKEEFVMNVLENEDLRPKFRPGKEELYDETIT